MKKAVAGAVVSVVAVGSLIASASPASADGFGHDGFVRNRSGRPVPIDCNYGDRYYPQMNKDWTLYERYSGAAWKSEAYCKDTDGFKTVRDMRCIKIPVGLTTRTFKSEGTHWFKLGGYTYVNVYAFTKARCGKSPWISSFLKRIS